MSEPQDAFEGWWETHPWHGLIPKGTLYESAVRAAWDARESLALTENRDLREALDWTLTELKSALGAVWEKNDWEHYGPVVQARRALLAKEVPERVSECCGAGCIDGTECYGDGVDAPVGVLVAGRCSRCHENAGMEEAE